MERAAEKLFLSHKDRLIRELGRGPLSDAEIGAVGQRELGPLWRGTYAQHRVPLRPGSYVMNTAKTYSSPGVHWVGLVIRGDAKAYVFDSFGRNPRHLVHARGKSVSAAGGLLVGSDPSDKEQREGTSICGQLSLAWLMVVRDLGLSAALIV